MGVKTFCLLFLLLSGCRPALECDYQTLIEAHNAERAKANATPLAENIVLDYIAQAHAEWMANHAKMEHQDIQKNIPAYCSGENIAYNQQSVTEVMHDWMNSTGHRKNILNTKFIAVGFGQAVAKNGDIYWCADFAGGSSLP